MLRRPADIPSGHINLPAVGVQAWGSILLVKTGPLEDIQKEWKNYCDFLKDRSHPFMGRCEDFLVVQPPGLAEESKPQATIIGSFLGGDLLQVESLKSLVGGPKQVEHCLEVLEKLFAVLAPWYVGSQFKELAHWKKVFQTGGGRGIILFEEYDWSVENAFGDLCGRKHYTEPLSWDVAFIQEEHLSGHLLGQGADARKRTAERPGLLHRLRDRVRVRFSLTHGDLHPENILADPDNVWLLDFGQTGDEAPTLYDFTKLEVYLRLWCLDLSPAARELDQGVAKFEKGLLDVLFGTASDPEALDELAGMMGAVPTVLRKVAACITWIRRRAAPYTLGSPDRGDYLAVLYLTVLQTLKYAGKERDRLPNYRMLVTLACLLEDLLCRLVGELEYPRGRESLDYRRLVTPEWLKAPGAPARIVYLMRRRDGRRALPFLAATRGVLQNQFHHLDVFDHTLLVMANLEELLRDPLAALRDPAGYERRVARALRKQGVKLPATRSRPIHTDPPSMTGLETHLEAIQALLARCLDEESQLLLKWLCLLHDVGKPATRCVQIDEESGLREVQFRGHEAYSAFLVEKHLEEIWFPGDAQVQARNRLTSLIKKHHFHHQRMETYLGKSAFDELRKDVLRGDKRGELERFFHFLEPESNRYLPDVPLLVLHGFADVAGCAGPKSGSGLGKVAELDLVLLAACVCFDQLPEDQQVAQQVSRVLDDKTMDKPGGKQYGELKRRLTSWIKAHDLAARPTDEAVRYEAERIAAEYRDRRTPGAD
jgi:hypothetical protein